MTVSGCKKMTQELQPCANAVAAQLRSCTKVTERYLERPLASGSREEIRLTVILVKRVSHRGGASAGRFQRRSRGAPQESHNDF
jgi:hypothetical protein